MPDDAFSSRIGLGLAALGRPAYITLDHGDDFAAGRSVADLRSRTHTMLDAAWHAGVRYVDAARSYGLAEEFLGSWLASHPGRRAELTIGSKWGYTYVGGWRLDAEQHERKDHRLATLERQWPETLDALGATPDIYLIHSLTPDSPVLRDRALLDRLGEVAAAGVRIGFSTSGPEQARVIRTALDLRPGSPFSAVQSTWNLLEPSAGGALVEAHDAGWRVVVKEAVANGRLTDRGRVPALAALAHRAGVGADALAIASALAQPWADVVLSGATTLDQLAGNLRADDARGLTAQEGAPFVQDALTYWAERSLLAWS